MSSQRNRRTSAVITAADRQQDSLARDLDEAQKSRKKGKGKVQTKTTEAPLRDKPVPEETQTALAAKIAGIVSEKVIKKPRAQKQSVQTEQSAVQKSASISKPKMESKAEEQEAETAPLIKRKKEMNAGQIAICEQAMRLTSIQFLQTRQLDLGLQEKIIADSFRQVQLSSAEKAAIRATLIKKVKGWYASWRKDWYKAVRKVAEQVQDMEFEMSVKGRPTAVEILSAEEVDLTGVWKQWQKALTPDERSASHNLLEQVAAQAVATAINFKGRSDMTKKLQELNEKTETLSFDDISEEPALKKLRVNNEDDSKETDVEGVSQE